MRVGSDTSGVEISYKSTFGPRHIALGRATWTSHTAQPVSVQAANAGATPNDA